MFCIQPLYMIPEAYCVGKTLVSSLSMSLRRPVPSHRRMEGRPQLVATQVFSVSAFNQVKVLPPYHDLNLKNTQSFWLCYLLMFFLLAVCCCHHSYH